MLERLFHDPVPDMAIAVERARFGADLLERLYGRDWHHKVCVDRLDIGSPFCCVLGQLLWQGHFQVAFLSLSEAVKCGFSCGAWDFLFFAQPPWISRSYDRLTEAWRLVLRERSAGDALPKVLPPTERDVSSDRRDSGQSSFHCVN
ncbi:MAG: hypothetical protein R3C59_03175 [Planctomycetaceae bacterium]